MKTVAFMHRNDSQSAVGDFSPVVTVFSHYEFGTTISPFLWLDHLGPGHLLPNSPRKGVSEHPHRGFETVTLVFDGEIAHRDTNGNGDVIHPGDVQWMTAASGILHEEFFSDAFRKRGGRFEMLQLWVNLPAESKMSAAAYQRLTNDTIPIVKLPNGAGTVRIIAGEFQQRVGVAKTHTRIGVLDVRIQAGHTLEIGIAAGDTAIVYLRSGRLEFAADEYLEVQDMAMMSNREADLSFSAAETSQCLVLFGEPLIEPLFGRGPFVMNSYDEILQAYDDLKHQRFLSHTKQ